MVFGGCGIAKQARCGRYAANMLVDGLQCFAPRVDVLVVYAEWVGDRKAINSWYANCKKALCVMWLELGLGIELGRGPHWEDVCVDVARKRLKALASGVPALRLSTEE